MSAASVAGEVAKALLPLALDFIKSPRKFFDSSPERIKYLPSVPEESESAKAHRRGLEKAKREFERSLLRPL